MKNNVCSPKSKVIFQLPVFFTLLIISALTFISCQTTGKTPLPEVKPLVLLGDDCDMYFSIPVVEEKELVSAFLSDYIPGLTEKDSAKLTDYVSRIYAGIIQKEKTSSFKIAGKQTFPKIALNSTLTEKKGWVKQKYESLSSEEAKALNYPYQFKYYTNAQAGMQLTFPGEDLFCASENVVPMLDKYAVRKQIEDNEINAFLTEESPDIHFYVNTPEAFIERISGVKAALGMEYLTGSLINIHENNQKTEKYSLELKVRVLNSKTMKAVLRIFTIAFKMFNGNVEQIDELTIKLSGLEMNREQIIAMLKE